MFDMLKGPPGPRPDKTGKCTGQKLRKRTEQGTRGNAPEFGGYNLVYSARKVQAPASVCFRVYFTESTRPLPPQLPLPPPLRSRKMSYHLLCQNSQKQPKSAFSAEYKLYRAERTLTGVVVHCCMRSGCTTNANLLR